MPPNFEPKSGFSPNDPSFFECVFSTQCPSLWKCEPYTCIHLILECPPTTLWMSLMTTQSYSMHYNFDTYSGVEIVLRISFLLAQRLKVELFNLICWEWPWSSLQWSFICKSLFFPSYYFHLDHLASMLCRLFSLAQAFYSSLVPSGPKFVSAWS